MDARLRSYASKRRSEPGAPESLHPATRHVLQSEVRRTFGAHDARADGSQSPWWRRWPGLVILGTACAAVAIALVVTDREIQQAAYVSQDRKSEAQELEKGEDYFAKTERDAPMDGVAGIKTASEPIQSAANEPQNGVVVLADSESEFQKPIGSREFRFLEKRPPPAAAAPPVDRLDAATTMLFFRVPSPESGVRQLAESKDSSSPLVQDASLRANPSPPPTPPLTEFNLQHADGKLTIRDSDGSVYLGIIRPIEVGSQIVRSEDKSSAALRSREVVQGNAIQSIPVEAGRYRINATGTNQSLQQRVVIDGELLQRQPRITNGVTQAPQEMRRLARFELLATNSLPAQWEFNSTLNVGTQNPVKIIAIQTPTATPSNSPAPRQP